MWLSLIINSDYGVISFSPPLVTYVLPPSPNTLPLALTRCVLTSLSRPSRVDDDRACDRTPRRNLGFRVVVVATNRNIEYRCYEVATLLLPMGVPCQMIWPLGRHVPMAERHQKRKKGTGKSFSKSFLCISITQAASSHLLLPSPFHLAPY